jgi:hypothetical protein
MDTKLLILTVVLCVIGNDLTNILDNFATHLSNHPCISTKIIKLLIVAIVLLVLLHQ